MTIGLTVLNEWGGEGGAVVGSGKVWGGSVPKTCSRSYEKVVFGNNNP